MPEDAVVTMYTDAAREKGRVATLVERFSHGTWPTEAQQEGVNWRESWAVARTLNLSAEMVTVRVSKCFCPYK